MQKYAALFALCAISAPVVHAEIDLRAKQLQVYGELHASVDFYDRGISTATGAEPAGTEITSNSSYIGLKGEFDLASAVLGIWKFESEFDLSGETDIIEARHRYVGLSSVAGSVVIGTHSTPFKEIGSRYTLFGDSVGDRSGIMGQTSSGDNQFNQRAKSMALYRIDKGGFSISLLYSPDFAGNSNPDHSGTNSRLHSFGLEYKRDHLRLAIAGEKQTAIDNVQGRNASGYRVGLRYKIGNFEFGGLFEALKDDGYGIAIERNAGAANIAYRILDFTLAGQYMHAGESAQAGAIDGARQYTIGLYYSPDQNVQIYLVYAALQNDPNASYQLARSGHGQAFSPSVSGEKISASSLGAIYNF